MSPEDIDPPYQKDDFDKDEEDSDPDLGKLNWQEIFLEEKMSGEPQSIPQSVIYELVNETINKEAFSIQCPKTFKGILKYIFLMPLTHTQYWTIPSPLSKRNDNYYPLSLFMSILWIFGYTYVITWFTYDICNAMNMRFSIIPMFLYPFGVAIRDIKKFLDFNLALETFRDELPDQEISLAETY